MSEIVVFPEQFSFDVRVQKNNPRRRLTIKNSGVLAAKVTVIFPESDAFIVTDAKGRIISGRLSINLIADSSTFLFVQKKSTVGIVPEDSLRVLGGKKEICVALKPAVSLVSMEELESVVKTTDEEKDKEKEKPKLPSLIRKDKSKPQKTFGTKTPIEFTADDFKHGDKVEVERKIPSLLNAPKSADNSEPTEVPIASKIPSLLKDVQSSGEEVESDVVRNSERKTGKAASEGRIPMSGISKVPDKESGKSESKIPMRINKSPVKSVTENGNEIGSKEAEDIEFDISDFQPQPQYVPNSKDKHSEEEESEEEQVKDVLEQSLHVKLSSHDEDFGSQASKHKFVTWYNQQEFETMEEPDFSFELMMTDDIQDPVFCMDGDYYDSSGRLLSVEQGKGKVVYVTEKGYDFGADS